MKFKYYDTKPEEKEVYPKIYMVSPLFYKWCRSCKRRFKGSYGWKVVYWGLCYYNPGFAMPMPEITHSYVCRNCATTEHDCYKIYKGW